LIKTRNVAVHAASSEFSIVDASFAGDPLSPTTDLAASCSIC